MTPNYGNAGGTHFPDGVKKLTTLQDEQAAWQKAEKERLRKEKRQSSKPDSGQPTVVISGGEPV